MLFLRDISSQAYTGNSEKAPHERTDGWPSSLDQFCQRFQPLCWLPLSEAGYIFLVLFTYEIFQVLLGLFMMALSPDLGFAGNVLVFIVCTCNWFNGIIVPYDQIQVFWRYWVSHFWPRLEFLLTFIALLPQSFHLSPGGHDKSC